MRTRIVLEGELGPDWAEWLDVMPPLLGISTTTQKRDCWRATWVKDFGRMGTLSSEYIVDAKGKALLEALAESGKEAYFSDVLGKHSEFTIGFDFTFEPEWTTEVDHLGFAYVNGLDPVNQFLNDARAALDLDWDVRITYDAFLAWARLPAAGGE